MMISATIHNWANSLAIDDDTLRKRLVVSGVKVAKNGQLMTAKEIWDALKGEKPSERLATAQAIEKERENKIAEGELITLTEVEELISKLLTLPLRQVLIALPSTLDVRCNPDHPQTSRTALREWSDEVLKLLREKLK